MVVYINSKENEKIKFAYKLKQEKYRKKYQKYLAEGAFDLELAIKAKVVEAVFTTKQLDIDENIVQYIVNEDIIKKISSLSTPQNIVFICSIKENKIDKLDKIIYLDEVNDPGNIGTIIRSAFALDYDLVCLSNKCASIYNPKTISASKGSIFLMPVIKKDLKEFKNTHHIFVSALKEEAVDIKQIKTKKPFVLVVGNEARGVSEESLSLADEIIYIPIKNIDSLNVAIASSIMMYLLK